MKSKRILALMLALVMTLSRLRRQQAGGNSR